ncbi:MAG: hypothetical protein JNL97_17690, partial [Verrucomicrobiales bacterium]|nr:hypothetical protein [Verrucomicrobiales bacterium]
MSTPLPRPMPCWVCFAVPEEAGPFRPHAPPNTEILVTGMGADNARRAFTGLLASAPGAPSFVLTCGFAGGLDPSLPRGSVVHDTSRDFPLARALVEAGSRPASFHCSTRVAITPAEKAELRQAT